MRTSWNNHETPTGLRALAADTWAELRDPGMWIDLIGSAIVTGGIALAIIAVLGR